jgi:lipoprotein-releasing system permease protein
LLVPTKTERLAAALIDLGVLLVVPLIPTLVLFIKYRGYAAIPADEYLRVMEGTALPIAEKLLGPGHTGQFILALPIAGWFILQWIWIAQKGQSLGQQVTGLRWDRNGQKPGFFVALTRTAILAVCGLGIGYLLPKTSFQLPLFLRFCAALAGLLVVEVFEVLSLGRTGRDIPLGLWEASGGASKTRAFQPPRFSSLAFVIGAGGLGASAIVSGLTFLAVSKVANLESTDIDVPAVIAGVALPLGLVLTGAFAAFKARRFVVGELALMSLLVSLSVFEGMIWGLIPAPALQRFMVPGMVDWGVYAVSTYFGSVIFLIIGSSLGFMVSSDQGADFSTRFERLVARRHLRLQYQHWLMLAVIATLAPIVIYGVFIWPIRAVRRLMRGDAIAKPLPPTVFMALLTIVGVMFGVMSLDVVLGVMGGFERDLKEKILGTTAHGIVQNYGGNFADWRDVEKKILSVPGVAGATPFIYGEVMITTENAVAGAILHGIDPETVSQVTDLSRSIAHPRGDGRLADLTYPDRIPRHSQHRPQDFPRGSQDEPSEPVPKDDDEVLPGIILGVEMAHSLRVWTGDRVTVMNPLGDLGPQGPVPRTRAFRVAAVFVTGMFEYDAKFAYIDLRQAQKFYRLNDSISGIELRFTNVDEARPLMRRIVSALGDFPYRGKDWGEMNNNLFSALRLERVVMFVLLSFQVLIACICVIATLVMLVIEKRKEVATLKAMGAREGSIMRLFVLEGLIIGGIGTFYGSAAGFFFCKLIEKFGVGLNPEIYYIEKLPVVIEGSAFISVAAVAMVLVFIATIYPARRGGSIAPVEGFREE